MECGWVECAVKASACGVWSVGGWNGAVKASACGVWVGGVCSEASVCGRLVRVECGWVECAVKASACVGCVAVKARRGVCSAKASACGVWVGGV